MSKPLYEELSYLAHAVEGETFHFIVVQWTHFSLIQKTKDYLLQQFPERSACSIHLKGTSYEPLISQILDQAGGFIFLDDFERLVDDPDLRVAFNQRRGKLARLPLTIVAFIPSGEKYVTKLIKTIPDWWSVLTFFTTLENKEEQINLSRTVFNEPQNTYTLGGKQQENRLAEIHRLKTRIADTAPKPENAALINQLYRQVLEICETAGLYQIGLETVNEWLKIAFALDYEKIDSITFSFLLDRIGTFEQYLGHYDRAISLMEKALELDLTNFGPDHSNVAVRQSNLAIVYRNLGQYERARDLLESALASNLKIFGPDHQSVANSQSNLANVYRNLGQYEQGRDLLEVALASDLKNFGPDDPSVAARQSNLAAVYFDLGQKEHARNLLEAALATNLKIFGPDHPKVATVQSNLAVVYGNLGQYERARDLLEATLESDLKNFGPNHPSIATRYNNLAHVYARMNESSKALEGFEKALTILKHNFGENHPYVGILLKSIVALKE